VGGWGEGQEEEGEEEGRGGHFGNSARRGFDKAGGAGGDAGDERAAVEVAGGKLVKGTSQSWLERCTSGWRPCTSRRCMKGRTTRRSCVAVRSCSRGPECASMPLTPVGAGDAGACPGAGAAQR